MHPISFNQINFQRSHNATWKLQNFFTHIHLFETLLEIIITVFNYTPSLVFFAHPAPSLFFFQIYLFLHR